MASREHQKIYLSKTNIHEKQQNKTWEKMGHIYIYIYIYIYEYITNDVRTQTSIPMSKLSTVRLIRTSRNIKWDHTHKNMGRKNLYHNTLSRVRLNFHKNKAKTIPVIVASGIFSLVIMTLSAEATGMAYLDQQVGYHFYPRPVLAFEYRRCLRLSLRGCVCASITSFSPR